MESSDCKKEKIKVIQLKTEITNNFYDSADPCLSQCTTEVVSFFIKHLIVIR